MYIWNPSIGWQFRKQSAVLKLARAARDRASRSIDPAQGFKVVGRRVGIATEDSFFFQHEGVRAAARRRGHHAGSASQISSEPAKVRQPQGSDGLALQSRQKPLSNEPQ
jgi:hypothetical protein